MDPIEAYLNNQTLPKDKKKAKKIEKRSILYYLKKNQLYKRSFSMPLIMCLNKKEVNYMLRELHEWICRSHIAKASLALKTLRNTHFGPTM